MLSGPVRPPEAGGLPDRLVVLLHGYGADGSDLIRSLTPAFARDLPHSEFVAPDAPNRIHFRGGYQWFPITGSDPDAIVAGLRRAAASLDEFVDAALAERNLDADRLAVVGFSQGAVLALDRALRRTDSGRAVVSFSGMLADSSCRLPDRARRPPVLLVQGTEDPIVPFVRLAETRTALEIAGFPVETMVRQGLGHAIDHEGAARAARFLARHLAGP